MGTDHPLLSCEDECRLLLEMARRSASPRMADQLRRQADLYAAGTEGTGAWVIEMLVDDAEDGPISEWLIDEGSCGVCGHGYQEHDRVFFVRPLVTAHARCILGILPRSDLELDAALAALAAGRSA